MNRSALWTLLASAIVLGLIWQFYPLEDARNRMEQLPLLGKRYMAKICR